MCFCQKCHLWDNLLNQTFNRLLCWPKLKSFGCSLSIPFLQREQISHEMTNISSSMFVTTSCSNSLCFVTGDVFKRKIFNMAISLFSQAIFSATLFSNLSSVTKAVITHNTTGKLDFTLHACSKRSIKFHFTWFLCWFLTLHESNFRLSEELQFKNSHLVNIVVILVLIHLTLDSLYTSLSGHKNCIEWAPPVQSLVWLIKILQVCSIQLNEPGPLLIRWVSHGCHMHIRFFHVIPC